MSTLRVLASFALSLFLLCAAPAQTLEHSITLDDGIPASADDGFGIVLAPDGIHAYAAIAGLVSFNPALNNDNIARLDVIAGTQVGLGQTQLFPEDPALTYDGTGAIRHVYVTNSTSGSVTCLTPALGAVATIAVPGCFGFPFPFGVIVSPDSSRVYVTTIGGCGDIHAIDSDPASPGFNTVVQSFVVPNAGGRANWGPYPLMVVPTTTYDASFTLSQAGFAVVDVTNPASQTSYVVTPPLNGLYTSTTECVVVPGGKVILSVSYGASPVLYELSIASGALLRTIDLTGVTDNSLHGLALNPDQTIGVVTALHGQDSVFFDVATFTVIGVHDHGPGALPNDVVFTPDGSRAVVSLQGVARVDVLKAIPGYALELAATASVSVGGTLTYSIDNCEAGQPWALYYSLAGAGPQMVGSYTVSLSSPFDLAYQAVGGIDGNASVSFVVPNIAGLPGMTVSTQAVTVDRDGGLRLSNGAQTLVN